MSAALRGRVFVRLGVVSLFGVVEAPECLLPRKLPGPMTAGSKSLPAQGVQAGGGVCWKSVAVEFDSLFRNADVSQDPGGRIDDGGVGGPGVGQNAV